MVEISQFLTVAGVATICTILVEMFKRLLEWDAAETARFAPIYAIAIGIIGSTAAAVIVGPQGNATTVPLTTAQLVFNGVMTGILGGATACGLYSIGGKSIIRAVAGPPPDGQTDVP